LRGVRARDEALRERFRLSALAAFLDLEEPERCAPAAGATALCDFAGGFGVPLAKLTPRAASNKRMKKVRRIGSVRRIQSNSSVALLEDTFEYRGWYGFVR